MPGKVLNQGMTLIPFGSCDERDLVRHCATRNASKNIEFLVQGKERSAEREGF